jgi:hypothetical protein
LNGYSGCGRIDLLYKKGSFHPAFESLQCGLHFSCIRPAPHLSHPTCYFLIHCLKIQGGRHQSAKEQILVRKSNMIAPSTYPVPSCPLPMSFKMPNSQGISVLMPGTFRPSIFSAAIPTSQSEPPCSNCSSGPLLPMSLVSN